MDYIDNNFSINNMFPISSNIKLDKNRIRHVVFYGRVSTEHEAQLSALQNQMQWYVDQANYHDNWVVVDKYIDEGITGTQAKKRPAFLRMLEDAKKRKFDLIVTREVCRFARNTVDTLVTTRELKGIGVEVFFVEDNIWTMDGDGELRLSLMATLAQEESRKVSERVKAGQKISRDKGVLYGSGNILGYDRDKEKKTYVINPEQAETVRMIFEMYASGMGEKKIVVELLKRHRKCGSGTVSWECSKVGRILKNATYKGYKCYNKYYSNNYLEQKRRKNYDTSSYIYVKGDFEPIVSEELWDKCNEMLKSKTRHMLKPDGTLKAYGSRNNESIYVRKLRCICGSTVIRRKWHQYKNGVYSYGFQCRRSIQKGRKDFRIQYGLESEHYCVGGTISDWKFDIMAYKLFSQYWNNREAVANKALAYFNRATDGQEKRKTLIALDDKLNVEIQKLRNKLVNIANMFAEEMIDLETFTAMKADCQTKIDEIQKQIINNQDNQTQINKSNQELDKTAIIRVLDGLKKITNFEGEKVPEEILEQCVNKIVMVDKTHFKWYMRNFSSNEDDSVYSILQTVLTKDELEKPMASFTIGFEEAKEYHFKNCYGVKTHPEAWQDLHVEIYY